MVWNNVVLAICMFLVGTLFGGGLRWYAASVSPVSVEATVVRLMKSCRESGSRNRCYQQVAETLTRQFPIPVVLAALAAEEQEPDVFARCHEVSHYLGRKLYQTNRTIPAAMASCTAVCHGGCYHGVVEGYFTGGLAGETDRKDDLGQFTRSACGSGSEFSSPRLFGECLHGIGHALMFLTVSDLPASLALCDARENHREAETCYGGVFMENSSSATSDVHPSRFVNPADPTYPCSILATRYQDVCYEYQSSYFDQISGGDAGKTIGLCLAIPSRYQEGCFRFFGANQVGRTQDLGEMVAGCAKVPGISFQTACFSGIAAELAGRYMGDVEKIAIFCRSVPAPATAACYRAAGAAFDALVQTQKEKQSLCLRLDAGAYQSVCMEAHDDGR